MYNVAIAIKAEGMSAPPSHAPILSQQQRTSDVLTPIQIQNIMTPIQCNIQPSQPLCISFASTSLHAIGFWFSSPLVPLVPWFSGSLQQHTVATDCMLIFVLCAESVVKKQIICSECCKSVKHDKSVHGRVSCKQRITKPDSYEHNCVRELVCEPGHQTACHIGGRLFAVAVVVAVAVATVAVAAAITLFTESVSRAMSTEATSCKAGAVCVAHARH